MPALVGGKIGVQIDGKIAQLILIDTDLCLNVTFAILKNRM
jgi:hypothetical protein